jgi:hypothetical protein
MNDWAFAPESLLSILKLKKIPVGKWPGVLTAFGYYKVRA